MAAPSHSLREKAKTIAGVSFLAISVPSSRCMSGEQREPTWVAAVQRRVGCSLGAEGCSLGTGGCSLGTGGCSLDNWGCSRLECIRLQPRVRRVAASSASGCSLEWIRLQPRMDRAAARAHLGRLRVVELGHGALEGVGAKVAGLVEHEVKAAAPSWEDPVLQRRGAVRRADDVARLPVHRRHPVRELARVGDGRLVGVRGRVRVRVWARVRVRVKVRVGVRVGMVAERKMQRAARGSRMMHSSHTTPRSLSRM